MKGWTIARAGSFTVALAFAFGAGGCTAIQKGLGIKQDLHDEDVRALALRLDRPALCPGDEGALIVDVTLADGRTLRSEGAGDGKVTWDSFHFEGDAISVLEDGAVMANPDPRPNLHAPPVITVHAVDHPGVSTSLHVPLRYDCAFSAGFSGRPGTDGNAGANGSDDLEKKNAGNGEPGENGGAGEPGADVTVRAALVRNDTNEEFLQVRVDEAGGQRPRFFLLDPRGSLSVSARGGDGGAGGKGGDGGKPNGVAGLGGSGGDAGNGGHIVLELDDEAAKYQDRFMFDVNAGHGGKKGVNGESGPEAKYDAVTYALDVLFGLINGDGRDGLPGTVTVKLQPVDPLW